MDAKPGKNMFTIAGQPVQATLPAASASRVLEMGKVADVLCLICFFQMDFTAVPTEFEGDK